MLSKFGYTQWVYLSGGKAVMETVETDGPAVSAGKQNTGRIRKHPPGV